MKYTSKDGSVVYVYRIEADQDRKDRGLLTLHPCGFVNLATMWGSFSTHWVVLDRDEHQGEDVRTHFLSKENEFILKHFASNKRDDIENVRHDVGGTLSKMKKLIQEEIDSEM